MKRETSVNRPWRVIIVGDGFGGLRAAPGVKSDLFDVTRSRGLYVRFGKNSRTHSKSGQCALRRYLRPATIKAGVRLDKGQRFGFHNLRHSLASFLVAKKTTDVKTAQRSMRHANSSIMLDHCARKDMDELLAAQERLHAIFRHSPGTAN